MSTLGIRCIALIALASAWPALMAQTYSRAQLEQQYRVTCSAQNLAASPFLRAQCVQIRAQIDQISDEGETGEDEEADSSPARPVPVTPSGAIGDPGMLTRERVYDDQCVRRVPRTDAERAQCQRLYQRINPATNGGPGAVTPNGRGGAGADRSTGGAPVDQNGRECISLVDQKLERWGNNNENTTRSYFFSNSCNHAMNITGQLSQADGSEQGAAVSICPGRTGKLLCSGFGAGKGCAQLIGYRVEPAPALTESCRR
ncbi:MAG: hypothetical protein IPG93_22870 [Burkholderiales bacterium]|nr:hypothetical protein [Burkholderiales bacterium]